MSATWIASTCAIGKHGCGAMSTVRDERLTTGARIHPAVGAFYPVHVRSANLKYGVERCGSSSRLETRVGELSEYSA